MTTKRAARAMKGKLLTPKQVRERILAFIETLPEAAAQECGGQHLSLEVRGKRFGWYLDDHHGDGRLAINCKAPRGVAQQMAAQFPDRFHIPRYAGHLGWVGLWLDTPRLDWREVEGVLEVEMANRQMWEAPDIVPKIIYADLRRDFQFAGGANCPDQAIIRNQFFSVLPVSSVVRSRREVLLFTPSYLIATLSAFDSFPSTITATSTSPRPVRERGSATLS